ncbi:MAG: hypothetical protein Q8O39_00700 [bacterium]|nr:hypothetical protein [bacterium]
MKDKKILVLILLAIIAIFICGYFYYAGMKVPEKAEEPKEEVKEGEIILPAGSTKETRPEAVTKIEELKEEAKILPVKNTCNPEEFKSPEGKVYLSLSAAVATSTIGVYEFDVKKKTLKEFLRNDSCSNFILDFSADSEKIVFVSDCQSDKEYIAVGKSDKSEIKKLMTTLPGEEETLKSRAIFSPDGKTIAITLMELKGDLLAESWPSFIVDLNGNIKLSTYGVMPLFSPDGKNLLVLKNPGIYKINLETEETERVIEFRDKDNKLILGQVNMMLSLSPDGKKLAWSNVDREEFYVFEINSWEPFTYKLLAQIKTNAFWSSFSPDGKYLAVQEADMKEDGSSGNPIISIFETCSFSKLFSYSLNKYDPMQMWITEWK